MHIVIAEENQIKAIVRKECKDVFNAFLVENAVYEGVLEIPALRGGMFHPDGD